MPARGASARAAGGTASGQFVPLGPEEVGQRCASSVFLQVPAGPAVCVRRLPADPRHPHRALDAVADGGLLPQSGPGSLSERLFGIRPRNPRTWGEHHPLEFNKFHGPKPKRKGARPEALSTEDSLRLLGPGGSARQEKGRDPADGSGAWFQPLGISERRTPCLPDDRSSGISILPDFLRE